MKSRDSIFQHLGEHRDWLAATLFLVLLWLGGAMSMHTLSPEHILQHTNSTESTSSDGSEECILLVFGNSPFDFCEEYVTQLVSFSSTEYQCSDEIALPSSHPFSHPLLRAPPIQPINC